jgi:predicted transposase YbfD/YdcC
LPAQYALITAPAPHGAEAAPPPGEEEGGLVAALAACAPLLEPEEEGGRCPLLEVFARVRDRRDPRGVRHALASILAMAVAAAACGETSLAAIARWAGCAEADQEMPAFLGARRDPATGRFRAPHADTFSRALGALDAQSLDDAAGAWVLARLSADRAADDDRPAEPAPPAETAAARGEGTADASADAEPRLRPAFAVDGKAMKITADGDGRIDYLLSAVDHAGGATFAQRAVEGKTNEITAFRPLLEGLALHGCVATMDALHTQRAHAEFLRGNGVHFMMIAKGNQPKLFEALDAVDWADVPVGDRAEDAGHGRHEVRTMRFADPPPGLPFPHVGGVFLLERYTRRPGGRGGGKIDTAVAELGVTSLTPAEATAAQLAVYARGHWTIENRSHWVRDVTYGEDASRVRDGDKPRHGHDP